MIPWDLDNSFVGAIMGWDYWNPSNVYEYDPYYTGGPYTGPSGTPQPWEARPLLFKLLNDSHYRKIYSAHMRTIIEESFIVITCTSLMINEVSIKILKNKNLIPKVKYLFII